MVKKIKECVAAKKDENFKIIARSDAKGVEGIDKMIDRCKAYIDAGAEIIFPEALKDEKEFELIRKNFYEWEDHKEENILTYRDKSFPSPVTGTVGPSHHTTWLEAMDDSMQTYLKTK